MSEHNISDNLGHVLTFVKIALDAILFLRARRQATGGTIQAPAKAHKLHIDAVQRTISSLDAWKKAHDGLHELTERLRLVDTVLDKVALDLDVLYGTWDMTVLAAKGILAQSVPLVTHEEYQRTTEAPEVPHGSLSSIRNSLVSLNYNVPNAATDLKELTEEVVSVKIESCIVRLPHGIGVSVAFHSSLHDRRHKAIDILSRVNGVIVNHIPLLSLLADELHKGDQHE